MITAPTGLGMYLALVSALLWAVFFLAYLILARPYRSAIGRALLLTSGSVAGVFALIASSVTVGDYANKDAVRVVTYGLSAIAGGRLIVLLVHAQTLRGRSGASDVFKKIRHGDQSTEEEDLMTVSEADDLTTAQDIDDDPESQVGGDVHDLPAHVFAESERFSDEQWADVERATAKEAS